MHANWKRLHKKIMLKTLPVSISCIILPNYKTIYKQEIYCKTKILIYWIVGKQ